MYQAFTSLPTFTYVIMGSIIFLFIVELIVQNLPRPHPLLAQSKQVLDSRRRFVMATKTLVVVGVAVVLMIYFSVISLKISNKDQSEDTLRALRVK